MNAVAAVTLQGMGDAPQRPRMIFDCPIVLGRAIKIRAAKFGLTPSELIVSVLERELVKEVQDAQEAIDSGAEPIRSKRGRKSKSKD